MIRHSRFIEHTIPHPSLPVSICEHVHRHQSCRANFEGVNQAQIVCTNGVYLERLSRLLVRRDLTDRNVIVCPAPKFQESKFPPITCHGTATRTYSSRKTRKSDTLITQALGSIDFIGQRDSRVSVPLSDQPNNSCKDCEINDSHTSSSTIFFSCCLHVIPNFFILIFYVTTLHYHANQYLNFQDQ